MQKMKRFSGNPTICWLTINRECNLRCSWCYAQGTLYKNHMTLEVASKFVKMAYDLNIKHITLIGGEPTCYTHLNELIRKIKKLKMTVGIVTNGILLANDIFLDGLIESGLDSINLSIKGTNRDEYINTTGADCFLDVIKAIKNISQRKVKLTVSYVLTNENIINFAFDLVKFKEAGASNFYISFCNPYFDENEVNGLQSNPNFLIKEFIKQYDYLVEKIENFVFHQNLPLCLWPQDFISRARDHLRTICQFQQKKGLIFDVDGKLLLCNSLYNFPYGVYGEDFFDSETLKEYLLSEKVITVYKELLKSPSTKCISCEKFSNCGGGCILHWINSTLEDLENSNGLEKTSKS